MEADYHAYDRMLREHVAPALRKSGLQAGSRGEFTLPSIGVVSFRMGRNRGELGFTVDLTGGGFASRIGHVMPIGRDVWWNVPPDNAMESVAGEVVDAIVSYGLPALREAVARQRMSLEPSGVEFDGRRRKALDDLERLSPPQGAPMPAPAVEPLLPYWPLHAPAPGTPTPAPLVGAVAAYRAAGWFERENTRTDEDLAAALVTTYRDVQGGNLLADLGALDPLLITLDSTRSLHDDIEQDVSDGESVYVDLLNALAGRSGGAWSVGDVVEDWSAEPGGVVIRFAMDGADQELRARVIEDLVDPRVVVGLNELVAPGLPRFYFVDDGGQDFILTRATAAERERLHELRPIRLDEHPPDWWR